MMKKKTDPSESSTYIHNPPGLPEMFEIHRHFVDVVVRRDEPKQSQLRGILLKHTSDAGEETYSGPTGNWVSNPSFVAVPFDNEEDAATAAYGIQRSWDSIHAHQSRQFETEEQLIAFQSAVESNGFKPRIIQLNMRLSTDEAVKVERIRLACRQGNLTIGNDKPIVSYADVIRYLLSQIA